MQQLLLQFLLEAGGGAGLREEVKGVGPAGVNGGLDQSSEEGMQSGGQGSRGGLSG